MTLSAQILFWTVMALLVLSMGVGLALLLVPGAAGRIAALPVGWRGKKGLRLPLDRVFSVERLFYRHHTLFGGLLVAGSLYSLVGLGMVLRRMAVGSGDWMASAHLLLLAGNGVTLGLGLLVMARPSLLKAPERLVNRWINVNITPPKSLVNTHDLVSRHPQSLGAFVCGGAVYALIELLRSYFQFSS